MPANNSQNPIDKHLTTQQVASEAGAPLETIKEYLHVLGFSNGTTRATTKHPAVFSELVAERCLRIGAFEGFQELPQLGTKVTTTTS
jgi:hypothetical protein